MAHIQVNSTSRPRTPTLSDATKEKMRLSVPQTSSANTPPKTPLKFKTLPPGSTPLIIQPNSELITILKSIQNTSAGVDAKITTQNEKFNEYSNRLTNLEENMRLLQSSVPCAEIEKPKDIPFETWDKIMNYDKRSDEYAAKLIKWLLFLNQRNGLHDNTRYILQDNHLLTDELLTKITWSGSKGKKTPKKPISHRRLFHDLRHALFKMYPTMTNADYKTAIQQALRAANSREQQRKKKRNNKENRPSVDQDLDDYFNNDWVAPDHDPEDNNNNREEDKEVRDGQS